MSTSSEEAAREIGSMPSTSAESLNPDLIDGVMKTLLKKCPIKDALRIKNACPQLLWSFSRRLAGHDHLRVAIHEPQTYQVVGGNKVFFKQPRLNVLIQGSRVSSADEAVGLLALLLREMRQVTRLSLVLEDTEQPIVKTLLGMLTEAENVTLEVLQCKRKEGGKPIEEIIQLVKANAASLRIIGRIGISEAARSFSEKVQLDRLSLMSLDKSMECPEEEITRELVAVQQSGATFEHLSYTSFVGFDPADEFYQCFLDSCGVRSLRLTMMKEPCFAARPDYAVGKVRGITHLEVGEVVERTNLLNKLEHNRAKYEKVFPNAGHITFFQVW